MGRGVQRQPWQKRFWKKVNKNGPVHPTQPELGNCWLWTGAVHVTGYGHFNMGGHSGKVVRVHRLVLEVHVGPPPDDRPVACHSCDRPLCVNPTHLRWDTQQENVRDEIRRQRRFVSPGKALLLYGVQADLALDGSLPPG